MLDLLYDFYQNGRIRRALSVAERADEKSEDLQARVDELERKVELLLMTSETLWSLLKEKHGWRDEALLERIREIDLQDGKLDGRVAKTSPTRCPACGKTIQKTARTCIYCGLKLPPAPFER